MRRWTPIVAHSVERRMKRVERSRSEGEVISDGRRLRSLEIARLLGREQVFAIESRRIPIIDDEIPAIQSVL